MGVLVRTVIRIALTLVLAAVPVFAIAQPAYADAVGSTPVGAFEYSTNGLKIGIPEGSFFTHVIRGKGLTITDENAGVDSIGPGLIGNGFCNWRIDFQYE